MALVDEPAVEAADSETSEDDRQPNATTPTKAQHPKTITDRARVLTKPSWLMGCQLRPRELSGIAAGATLIRAANALPAAVGSSMLNNLNSTKTFTALPMLRRRPLASTQVVGLLLDRRARQVQAHS